MTIPATKPFRNGTLTFAMVFFFFLFPMTNDFVQFGSGNFLEFFSLKEHLKFFCINLYVFNEFVL